MYRQISLYARVTFLKNAVQNAITHTKHKIPIQSNVFPGGQETDNLILYSVWDYITSEHTDL
jgi:hypothetical protein